MEAKFGQLLPLSFLESQPSISSTEDHTQVYKVLSAVGMRIDPELRLIKLVFQPLTNKIFPWEAKEVTTEDMAVHVFYELSSSEFKNFIDQYRVLKNQYNVRATLSALSVHPILKNEKMQGPYSKALSQLILKYTGQTKITQITTMQLLSVGGIWNFTGVTVKDGKFKAIVIPRIEKTEQEFTNVGRGDFIAAEMRPKPLGKDTFNNIMMADISPVRDMVILREEVAAAFRIENPKVHNTESMDCVSCHTAQPVKVWANKYFPQEMATQSFDSYKSTFNLKNISPVKNNLSNIRAFGYLNAEVAINQRVINESAEVASYLNSKE